MKKIFVIGGMGAGKSTAAHALTACGLPLIDLDKVGHDVLLMPVVKAELRDTFGDGIFDESGEVVRSALARVAFLTPTDTRKLNRITMPRIEDMFHQLLDAYEAEGHAAVVVEYSVFKNREMSLAYCADIVLAVLAPMELRVQRAVAAGWDELDVRRRIARQITDADRADQADVSFTNDGTPEDLADAVRAWWLSYAAAEGLDAAPCQAAPCQAAPSEAGEPAACAGSQAAPETSSPARGE